jgi:hypothetical protein
LPYQWVCIDAPEPAILVDDEHLEKTEARLSISSARAVLSREIKGADLQKKVKDKVWLANMFASLRVFEHKEVLVAIPKDQPQNPIAFDIHGLCRTFERAEAQLSINDSCTHLRRRQRGSLSESLDEDLVDKHVIFTRSLSVYHIRIRNFESQIAEPYMPVAQSFFETER